MLHLVKEIEIPTLKAELALKIPEGTQTGKLFRLRGKGVRPVRSSRSVGDLLCRIVVETPVNLTSRQRNYLKNYKHLSMVKTVLLHQRKNLFFDRLFD